MDIDWIALDMDCIGSCILERKCHIFVGLDWIGMLQFPLGNKIGLDCIGWVALHFTFALL